MLSAQDFAHLCTWPGQHECFALFQGEGVAYRGRVLVELSTQLDGKIDKNVDDICSDDVLVAQVFNVRRAVSLSAYLQLGEPGPAEGFVLLSGRVSCNCSSLRGQPLAFSNAPRENLDRNRRYINKVELNWIEHQFVSCWHVVMFQLDRRNPLISHPYFYFPEVPTKKEVLSVCCVPQCVHAPRAGWGHSVWG